MERVVPASRDISGCRVSCLYFILPLRLRLEQGYIEAQSKKTIAEIISKTEVQHYKKKLKTTTTTIIIITLVLLLHRPNTYQQVNIGALMLLNRDTQNTGLFLCSFQQPLRKSLNFFKRLLHSPTHPQHLFFSRDNH